MAAERERVLVIIDKHLARMERDNPEDREPASLRAYAYAAHALRAVAELVRSGRTDWREGQIEAANNEQARIDAMLAKMKAEQEAERWDD